VSLAGVTANFVTRSLTLLVVLTVRIERGAGGRAVINRAAGAARIELNSFWRCSTCCGASARWLAPGGALPAGAAATWRRFERYGTLLFVVLLLTGAIRYVLWPAFALEDASWALIEWWT
jgi:hypothetical protein